MAQPLSRIVGEGAGGEGENPQPGALAPAAVNSLSRNYLKGSDLAFANCKALELLPALQDILPRKLVEHLGSLRVALAQYTEA